MPEPYGRSAGFAPALQYDEGLRAHMLRIYNYMGLGLAVTGLVAVLVASVPALYVPIFSTPLKWLVMLAPLGFVFFLSFRIESISGATARTSASTAAPTLDSATWPGLLLRAGEPLTSTMVPLSVRCLAPRRTTLA